VWRCSLLRILLVPLEFNANGRWLQIGDSATADLSVNF